MSTTTRFTIAELDFRKVTGNPAVQKQGIITCIKTNKGWFWGMCWEVSN